MAFQIDDLALYRPKLIFKLLQTGGQRLRFNAGFDSLQCVGYRFFYLLRFLLVVFQRLVLFQVFKLTVIAFIR